jgi:hypothetical protein
MGVKATNGKLNFAEDAMVKFGADAWDSTLERSTTI